MAASAAAGTSVPDEAHVVHDGVRTRSLRLEGAGPTLVLLHGFTDSADTWRPLMRELARAGQAAVAVDLPHFGRAERPRGAGRLLPAYDRFVAHLASAEDLGDGVVLVGSSLGGLIALRAAQNAAVPVRAVVAIGPAGLGVQPWVDLLHRVALLITLAARTPLPLPVVRALVGQAYGRLAARHPLDEDTRRRFASHIEPGDLGRILALGRQVLQEISAPDALDLAAIDAPVTLIWGRHDVLCPVAGATRLTDVIPAARVIVHEDSGHCVHLDDPGAVAVTLLSVTSRSE